MVSSIELIELSALLFRRLLIFESIDVTKPYRTATAIATAAKTLKYGFLSHSMMINRKGSTE